MGSTRNSSAIWEMGWEMGYFKTIPGNGWEMGRVKMGEHCFRPLTNSSPIAPKVLKSLFKRLNNRNSNISSLREVRRLLMAKPAILKILSTAAVVGVAQKTLRKPA